jgi:hypothetical protein
VRAEKPGIDLPHGRRLINLNSEDIDELQDANADAQRLHAQRMMPALMMLSTKLYLVSVRTDPDSLQISDFSICMYKCMHVHK